MKQLIYENIVGKIFQNEFLKEFLANCEAIQQILNFSDSGKMGQPAVFTILVLLHLIWVE